jgi:hypothetical protein
VEYFLLEIAPVIHGAPIFQGPSTGTWLPRRLCIRRRDRCAMAIRQGPPGSLGQGVGSFFCDGTYLGQHWRRLGQNGYDIFVRTEIFAMQTGGVTW